MAGTKLGMNYMIGPLQRLGSKRQNGGQQVDTTPIEITLSLLNVLMHREKTRRVVMTLITHKNSM